MRILLLNLTANLRNINTWRKKTGTTIPKHRTTFLDTRLSMFSSYLITFVNVVGKDLVPKQTSERKTRFSERRWQYSPPTSGGERPYCPCWCELGQWKYLLPFFLQICKFPNNTETRFWSVPTSRFGNVVAAVLFRRW